MITNFQQADRELRTARSEAAGKPVARNTRLYRSNEDEIVLRFWYTDILTYHRNGTIKLDARGHRSATTKERMSGFLPSGFYISQRNFEWFLRSPDGTEVPYEDGTVVSEKEGMVVWLPHRAMRTTLASAGVGSVSLV